MKVKVKKCNEQFKNLIIDPYHYLAEQEGFDETHNWITRLPLADIAWLPQCVSCCPKSYIDKIKDDSECGLSGDVYFGSFYDDSMEEHYDVLHCIRGGHRDGKPKMKTDTFLHQIGNDVSACYHVDDRSGRYWCPSDYEQMRNNMKHVEVYDADANCLSNLVSPIWKSIHGD